MIEPLSPETIEKLLPVNDGYVYYKDFGRVIAKEAQRFTLKQLESQMELERCDPDVMPYFEDYYWIPKSAWQELRKQTEPIPDVPGDAGYNPSEFETKSNTTLEALWNEIICPMCVRLNPQHKDCTSCSEKENWLTK